MSYLLLQVFVSYCEDGEYTKRKEILSKYIGECKCSLCEEDRRDGEENLNKRGELHKELTVQMNAGDAEMHKWYSSVAGCKEIVKRREMIVKKMEATFR